MKIVKKILGLASFVTLVALVCYFFMKASSSPIVTEVNAQLAWFADYLVSWSPTDMFYNITKVGFLGCMTALFVIPVISLCVSVKKKKCSCEPRKFDFVVSLLASFVGLSVAVISYREVGQAVGNTREVVSTVLFIAYLVLSVAYYCVSFVSLVKAKAGVEAPCCCKAPAEEKVEEQPKEETPAVEEKVEEPVVEEKVEEPVEEVVEEQSEEVNEGEKTPVEKRPTITYTERLARSEETLKQQYSELKNELLSHRKVRSRITKSCETFRVGYNQVAKLVVAGKGLKLYLALDPRSVDSAIYHQRDASSKKRFVEVPLVVKVKSPLSLRKAKQLIAKVCEEKEIVKKSRYETVDYSKVGVEQ